MFIFILLVASSSAIVIRENGYENILVGIDTKVEEDGRLLEAIKELFTNSSSFLYHAMRQRAYFKEVKIIIPPSWEKTVVDDWTDVVFDDSDIRVFPPSHTQRNNPHTLQTRGCGHPGDYIHLTSDFVLGLHGPSIDLFGEPAKVLVHEWAHLRYGVFDEYGTPGDSLYPYFFRRGNQKNEVTEPKVVFNVCAAKDVSGRMWNMKTGRDCKMDRKTDLPDENCRFEVEADSVVQVSLMSFPHIESASFFCDDEGEHRHDPEAPNKHNALCGGRSTWDVIKSSKDFADGRNDPAFIADTNPTFRVMQTMSPRFVLVVDMSGKSHVEISDIRLTIKRWITYELPNNVALGIIEFSNTAVHVLPLTPIHNVRQNPKHVKMPAHSHRSRCIGCGLDAARKMLGKGGVMIVVTDGSENQSPLISSIKADILNSAIRVVSISVTELADPQTETLADATDGVKIFSKEMRDLSRVLSNLGIYTRLHALAKSDILLFEDVYTQFGIYTGEFVVDASAKDVVFLVAHSRASVLVHLIIHSPLDYIYILEDAEEDVENGVTIIEPKTLEEGMWTFFLRLEEMTPDDYVHVSVKAKVDPERAIKTSCWISPQLTTIDPEETRVAVFAKVEQKSQPVIGAKVMAQVTQPGLVSNKFQLDLWDNGAGADITRNDGIYSRYLTGFSGPGHYIVRCRAWNDGQAFLSKEFSSSGVLPRNPGLLSPNQRIFNGTDFISDVNNFTREATAGSFKITKPVSRRDTLPPYPITDLTGRIVSRMIDKQSGKKRRTFLLRWTATGDDLDKGRASHYMLKIATNFNDLLGSNFEKMVTATERDLLAGSLVPLVAGEIQEVVLNPRSLNLKANVVFYFAIKAMDDSGNISDLSNVISMTIAKKSGSRGGGRGKKKMKDKKKKKKNKKNPLTE